MERIITETAARSLLLLLGTGVLACSSEAGDGSSTTPVLSGVPGAPDPAGTGAPPAIGGMGSMSPGVTMPDGAPPGTGVAPPGGSGVTDHATPTPNTPVNQQTTVAPDHIVNDDGTTLDCRMLQRPPTPLRRLTRVEYDNTVRDLLGTTLKPASSFPPDEVADGFTNNAVVLTVSALHAEKYVEASEALAAEAVANLDALVGCDPVASGEEACAREFARDFGRRAYRRDLSTEDVDALMEAYAVGGSFQKGIEVMLRAMLQSPHFLYRVEFTGADTPGAGMVRLNGYETATRLSYLLWTTMPDDALLDAAASGQLDTPEQVAAKAHEMLQDQRARGAAAEFARQWLSLNRLEGVSKDTAAFPLWSHDMRAAMLREASAMVEHVVFDGAGTLDALLTEPVGLAAGPLATLYGVPEAVGMVALPPEQQRAGILTMPGFLAVQAHPDQTSPVLRGEFVRARLMCTPPPPPPPEANITPPEPGEGGTARERFTRHVSDEACAGCHQLMDPLGFPFEYFDAMGVFRTTENGQAIDVSGEMFASKDMDGPFVGVPELATKLAASGQVRDCVATQWFKYSIGRTEEAGDACSLTPLQDQFAASGANLKDLIVAMTQTEAFLYRRAVTAEEVAQ